MTIKLYHISGWNSSFIFAFLLNLPAFLIGIMPYFKNTKTQKLLQHMERRITIEELSKQFLINPTTLKATFKSVYGTSLAAHIKKHRMEQAAKMLRDTNMSIASIAQAVGYDSQSKFTASFKDSFQILPREYRKRLSTTGD